MVCPLFLGRRIVIELQTGWLVPFRELAASRAEGAGRPGGWAEKELCEPAPRTADGVTLTGREPGPGRGPDRAPCRAQVSPPVPLCAAFNSRANAVPLHGTGAKPKGSAWAPPRPPCCRPPRAPFSAPHFDRLPTECPHFFPLFLFSFRKLALLTLTFLSSTLNRSSCGRSQKRSSEHRRPGGRPVSVC